MFKTDDHIGVLSRNSRPAMLGWTLSAWLVFWVIGFPTACVGYPHGDGFQFSWWAAMTLGAAVTLTVIYLQFSRRAIELNLAEKTVTLIRGPHRRTIALGGFQEVVVETRRFGPCTTYDAR